MRPERAKALKYRAINKAFALSNAFRNKGDKKSPNLNHLRLGESVEKIIKYEQYQLNRGLNVEFDFIQPSLDTEAGTGLVDVREITMT